MTGAMSLDFVRSGPSNVYCCRAFSFALAGAFLVLQWVGEGDAKLKLLGPSSSRQVCLQICIFLVLCHQCRLCSLLPPLHCLPVRSCSFVQIWEFRLLQSSAGCCRKNIFIAVHMILQAHLTSVTLTVWSWFGTTIGKWAATLLSTPNRW